MKKICLMAALAAVVLLCLVACGGGDAGQETNTPADDTTPAPLPTVTLASGGSSDYTIICARGDSLDRMYEFKTLFADATGIDLPYKIDGSCEIVEGAREIVIGRTDRDGLFEVPFDSLVSDAYLLHLEGERLLICAASREGYARAFAELFKQTLNVEDINDMQTQGDVAVSLPEGFSVTAAPTLAIDGNKTASGVGYAVEGHTGGAYGYYTFDKAITYRFDTAVSDSFNYYTLRYSSSAYLKAELVYTRGGEQYTEQLFLEPGQRMGFSSLCDDAARGEGGVGITELRLSIIKGKGAEFILEDVSACMRELPDEVVYISTEDYRLGVKLAWGGGISYLEDLKDGNDAISNLLNDHDTGRLVQQSYYGTQKAPYNPVKYGDTLWSYNPVQGGDQYNNRSKLVDYSISEDGKSIYVKCRPLDWAQNDMLTPSYMENTYTIDGDLIRVDNRFVDFSGYTHQAAHQELPAFYTISYLCDFVFYNGTKGFSGDGLTVKKDLPFWAGNSGAYFDMRSKETWCAWVGPDGYGVGVYTPIAEILLAGRHMYNGSTSSKDPATNYVAPLITHTMSTLEPFEYSYYITTGQVDNVRATFEGVYREQK